MVTGEERAGPNSVESGGGHRFFFKTEAREFRAHCTSIFRLPLSPKVCASGRLKPPEWGLLWVGKLLQGYQNLKEVSGQDA